MKVVVSKKIVVIIVRVISATNNANVCKHGKTHICELCLGFPLDGYALV